MKTTTLLIIALILICSGNMGRKEAVANDNINNATIRIASTPDLYKLADKWSNEYGRLNPGINIDVIQITETEIPGIFQDGTNIGFVSSQYFRALDAQSIWQVVVGRDVIVPVINSNNPLLDQINEKGISAEAFAQLIINTDRNDWGTLFNNGQDVPVHYYMINDESIKSGMLNFLKIDQTAIHGKMLENKQEMISAIQSDPYAVGFCRITDIIDLTDQIIVENIQLLPIDKNGNGRIDYFEDIYNDLHAFIRGVWIGKYPKALCSNIYTVSSSKPVSEAEVAFLKWVITDGQKYLISNGYTDLVFGERQMKLDKLRNDKVFVENSNDRYATQKIILLIIIGIVVLGFVVSRVNRYRRQKIEVVLDNISPSSPAFNENSVEIPNGLYFDKSHTWAFMEKDGIVKVGIDDFLQHTTGPVTQTIMKNPGDKIKKGEQIMTLVQNGKHLNICAPISGTIKDINDILVTDPSMINSAPYAEGWVYMIEPSNWIREVEFLKMAGSYKQWLLNEFSRLKDFIAVSVKSDSLVSAHVVLQEGGELKDNILQNFGPELWEDFQKHFIDTSQLR
ncbi:MAG: hypothetical protein K8R74_12435 [Bacteroidales bacterium]|nr:hypothetical protein [Bacteroidales bacterium]